MPSLPTVTLSPTVSLAWEHCSSLGHEMIVTTHGRRIFPCLEYTIQGLDPQKLYSMCVHLEFVDTKRLRYLNGRFVESESTEKKDPPRKVFHPCGVQNGQKWMSRTVDFNHIRITNKKSMEEKSTAYVHLHTQHRYMPVLTIYEEEQPFYIACVPNTVFHTVTGYHSEILDKYKTSLNPFATGSRPERVEKRKGGAKGTTYGTPKRFKATKRDADTEMFQKMFKTMMGNLVSGMNGLPAIQVEPSPLQKTPEEPSPPVSPKIEEGVSLAPPLQDFSKFFPQFPMFPIGMPFTPFFPTSYFNPFVPNIFPTPSVSPSSDVGSCPLVPEKDEEEQEVDVDVVC